VKSVVFRAQHLLAGPTPIRQKTYQLGWFSGYHVDFSNVNDSINWTGDLTGFANRYQAAEEKNDYQDLGWKR
jgi:hypothetical protein